MDLKLKVFITGLLLSVIFSSISPDIDAPVSSGSSRQINYPDIRSELTLSSDPGLSHTLLGSTSYIREISRLEKLSGSSAAISRIISDMDKYGYELDMNSQSDIMRFYSLVSRLVEHMGHVDMKIHYFRNRLNRAPTSLSDFISLNLGLAPDKRWQLISVQNSLYHMQGKGGEYNLKFVSPGGYCEAVYNKDGVLLTEENDPVNMGTFNYAAGIREKNSHHKYDVEPFLNWGNSPHSSQKGREAIRKGVEKAYGNYMEHSANVNAYRSRILGMYAVCRPKAVNPAFRHTFTPAELLRYNLHFSTREAGIYNTKVSAVTGYIPEA